MYIGLIIYWYVGKYDVVFLNKQEHTCSHFPSVFQFRKIDKFCMIRYIPRIESYLYLNQNVYQFHITYMYITFHAHLSKNWGGGAVIGILCPCISIIIFIYCVKVSSYRYIMIMLIFVKLSPASCLYNYFPFEFILFILFV